MQKGHYLFIFCNLEADVAQTVSAWLYELEGYQFDPCRSIDVCFDFPLFCVGVALNGVRSAHRGSQVYQSS